MALKTTSRGPSALDLFAGAGGLSLGFRQMGYSIEGGIEIDDWAATTFEANLNTDAYRLDISQTPTEFFRRFTGVDAVIGGPPCQGFSISASNRRRPDDPRNLCYRDFLRVVSVIRPRLVLIENVRQFSSMRNEYGGRLLDEVLAFLDGGGYLADYGLLNAKYYGVPQERIRFFLLASRDRKPSLPFPTHGDAAGLFGKGKVLTLWDAISDLPEVTPRLHMEEDVFDYPSDPRNEYQAELRSNCAMIRNHIPMRHTTRTVERFSQIKVGDTGADVPSHLRPFSRSNRVEVSQRIYDQNHRRLDPTKPCSTITASFYSSFIHPYQNRNLTVREAARVQGFPDSFVFHGKRTRLSHKLLTRKGIFEDVHLDQFNQVGNAVPPILARRLAEALLVSTEPGGK